MKYLFALIKRDFHCLKYILALKLNHRPYDEIQIRHYQLKAFPKIKWKWSKHTYVGCDCGKHFYGNKTIDLDNAK